MPIDPRTGRQVDRYGRELNAAGQPISAAQPSYNPLTGRITVTREDIQGFQNVVPREVGIIQAPIDERTASVVQPMMNRATTMDFGFGTALKGQPGVPATPYGETTLLSAMNEPYALEPVNKTKSVLTTAPRTTPEQQAAWDASIAMHGIGSINAGVPQQFARDTDFLSLKSSRLRGQHYAGRPRKDHCGHAERAKGWRWP